jgi:hypothetical protein
VPEEEHKRINESKARTSCKTHITELLNIAEHIDIDKILMHILPYILATKYTSSATPNKLDYAYLKMPKLAEQVSFMIQRILLPQGTTFITSTGAYIQRTEEFAYTSASSTTAPQIQPLQPGSMLPAFGSTAAQQHQHLKNQMKKQMNNQHKRGAATVAAMGGMQLGTIPHQQYGTTSPYGIATPAPHGTTMSLPYGATTMAPSYGTTMHSPSY